VIASDRGEKKRIGFANEKEKKSLGSHANKFDPVGLAETGRH
jgi:hypothetical protein